MKNYLLYSLILLFNLNTIFTQDIDFFIKSAEEGKIEIALDAIVELEQNYPNHPGVLYLNALLEIDGEKAKNLFKDLYDKHPSDDKYTPLAVMRLGEYYYSTGSYIQASEWLKKMPIYYSRSDRIEDALKLFLNSLIITGKTDTAKHYIRVFERRFPKMDFDINTMISETQTKTSRELTPIVQDTKSEYSLQIGAYGDKKNAQRILQKLVINGFSGRIDESNSNGKRLFIVREGYFSSRELAMKHIQLVKKKTGLDGILHKNK
jgi:tetratricopeptide (TPR) repeat protein